MTNTVRVVCIVAAMVFMTACEKAPLPALTAPSVVLNPSFQAPLTVQPASGPVGLQPKVQWSAEAQFVELKRGEKVLARQASGLLVDEPLGAGQWNYTLSVSEDGQKWTELAQASVSVR